MTLPIISADERLNSPRGIKGCILGISGIGKTSLLCSLIVIIKPSQIQKNSRFWKWERFVFFTEKYPYVE